MLALLLVLGRALHGKLAAPSLRLRWLLRAMPHALIGGILGLFAVCWLDLEDAEMAVVLRAGLHEMTANLVRRGGRGGGENGGMHLARGGGASLSIPGGARRTPPASQVPFSFAALMLGFSASNSLGPQHGDLFTSWRMVGAVLWHEGIPMLVYTQVRRRAVEQGWCGEGGRCCGGG